MAVDHFKGTIRATGVHFLKKNISRCEKGADKLQLYSLSARVRLRSVMRDALKYNIARLRSSERDDIRRKRGSSGVLILGL